jgi:hypothetical protein
MKFNLKLLPFNCLLVLILLSCDSGKSEETEGDFYNLKGFVTGQIELLTELRPTVNKKMMVGDSVETRETVSIDWEKELELFAQADLNRPANRLIYETIQDSTSITYTLKKDEDAPVRFLKITLNANSENPVKVEAKLNTKNQLYESEKNLLLNAREVDGQWRIQSYKVSGFQDLVISERKPFQIEAVISYR